MRVLVCGGRDYQNRAEVDRVFGCLAGGIDLVIHGNAFGADTLVDEWCRAHDIQRAVFPANWTKYGKAAGPIRNQQMIDEGKPTICIAFPGGRGTLDMVERAHKANIPVTLIEN